MLYEILEINELNSAAYADVYGEHSDETVREYSSMFGDDIEVKLIEIEFRIAGYSNRVACQVAMENGKAFFIKSGVLMSRDYDIIRALDIEDEFDTIDQDEEFFEYVLTKIEEAL